MKKPPSLGRSNYEVEIHFELKSPNVKEQGAPGTNLDRGGKGVKNSRRTSHRKGAERILKTPEEPSGRRVTCLQGYSGNERGGRGVESMVCRGNDTSFRNWTTVCPETSWSGRFIPGIRKKKGSWTAGVVRVPNPRALKKKSSRYEKSAGPTPFTSVGNPDFLQRFTGRDPRFNLIRVELRLRRKKTATWSGNASLPGNRLSQKPNREQKEKTYRVRGRGPSDFSKIPWGRAPPLGAT